MSVKVRVGDKVITFPDQATAEAYFAENPDGPKIDPPSLPTKKEVAKNEVAKIMTPKTGLEAIDAMKPGDSDAWKKSALALATGARFPGTGLAYAQMETNPQFAKDVLSGKMKGKGLRDYVISYGNKYLGNYKRFNRRMEDIRKDAPIASAVGSIAPTIAEYGLGTKALSAPFQGSKFLEPFLNMPKVGPALRYLGRGTAGGVVNAAMGQQGGIDPKRLPSDFAWGFAGENFVPTVEPAVNAVYGGIKKGGRWLGGKLLESVVPRAKAVKMKDLEQGFDFGGELYDRNIWGRAKGIEKQARKGLTENENKLQSLLEAKSSGIPDKVRSSTVADEMRGVLDDYAGVAGEDAARNTVSSMADEVAAMPDQTVLDANKAKRRIYAIKEKSYVSQAADPAKGAAQKAQARGLKKEIERIVPESTAINKELKVYGKVLDSLKNKNSTNSNLLKAGLTRLGLAGALGGYGYQQGGLEDAIKYGSLAIATGTPAARSGAARWAIKAPIEAAGIVGRNIKPIIRYIPPAVTAAKQNMEGANAY